MSTPIKQVIVIRKDLKMRRGKEIAQGAHAAMAFLSRRVNNGQITPVQKEWLETSFRKICLIVESEAELDDIAEKATAKGIECHVVIDNGLTEFNGVATKTCLALGPDLDSILNEITGKLKLY